MSLYELDNSSGEISLGALLDRQEGEAADPGA